MSTLLDCLNSSLPRNKWRKHRPFYFKPYADVIVDFHNKSSNRIFGKVDMDMAHHILRKQQINHTVMLTAMLYSQRFRDRVQSTASLYLPNDIMDIPSVRDITSTDLFMVSLMLASKYLYDEGSKEELFNDEWAQLFNLETNQVNHLEADYLQFMDWNLFISKHEFESFVANIERLICLQSIANRNEGRMSWIELDTLTKSLQDQLALLNDLTHFVKTMAILLCLYVSAVASAVLISGALLNYTHGKQSINENPLFLMLPSSPGPKDINWSCLLSKPSPPFSHSLCTPQLFNILSNATDDIFISVHSLLSY